MELEQEFRNLSMKFLFVCDNNAELNHLLDDLNSLDYKHQQISDSTLIVQSIESLATIPTSTNVNTIIKACHLIKQLKTKQKINLPDVVSNKIVNWILQIHQKSKDIFTCEALDVLTLLFKKNAKAVSANIDCMLSENGILNKLLKQPADLQKILQHDYTPQEIYKSVLACIESILIHLEQDDEFNISNEYLEIVGRLLLKFAYNFKPNEILDSDFIIIMTFTISSLKFICQANSDFSTEHIGELLGISRAFMMYGLGDAQFNTPVKVFSSQQAVMEPTSSSRNRNGNNQAKAKKQAKTNRRRANERSGDNKRHFKDYRGFGNVNRDDAHFSFSLYRTSDSDFSDNEHSRELISRNKQSKLRLTALSLLLITTISVDRKIMFGYWHSLLATDESVTITLVNCILKDTSPRCKIVALQTIIQLLKNSKALLHQAENRDKTPSTFTPFSVTLGNIISFTYEKLTQALIKEGDLTVLTQILKCISIFITVTPFHRLQPGIVTKFVKFIRLLVRHKDPTIKVAALIVMENLISLQDMTSEIYELVEIPKSKIEFNWKKIDESIRNAQPKDENEFIELEFEDEDDPEDSTESQIDLVPSKMSWLLQSVLENLGIHKGVLKTPSLSVSVRIQSLQVLTAMTSHFLLLKDHLMLISTALSKCLQDAPADEKLHASRTIENLGSSINNYLVQDANTPGVIDISHAFWIRMIPCIIENIQNINQSPTLRASLADSLANLGVHIFESLDVKKQTQLKSVLTGCSYDDDPNVKSSAVRALAVYVLFPTLRDDLCFIENITESVLRVMKEHNVVARTKASFGLSNVVDCLLLIKDSHSISEDLLKQIVETCLHAGSDNDRVKVNAVRTLGSSVILLSRNQLENPVWLNLFEKSIQMLNHQLINCSNVKVKWNICYSFSSMMKNPLVFEEDLVYKWRESVFKTLCTTIETSPNFKVRTKSCMALTTPVNRIDYNVHFTEIWTCLLKALDQSNNLTDFNEYKHRDMLQDQICSSLCHLMSLTIIDDIIHMKNALYPLIDVTKQNWNRVINRLPPEFQNNVLIACNVIKKIGSESKNSEQKNSSNIIVACFEPVEQQF